MSGFDSESAFFVFNKTNRLWGTHIRNSSVIMIPCVNHIHIQQLQLIPFCTAIQCSTTCNKTVKIVQCVVFSSRFSMPLMMHEDPTAMLLLRKCSVVYLGGEYHNELMQIFYKWPTNCKFMWFGKKQAVNHLGRKRVRSYRWTELSALSIRIGSPITNVKKTFLHALKILLSSEAEMCGDY